MSSWLGEGSSMGDGQENVVCWVMIGLMSLYCKDRV